MLTCLTNAIPIFCPFSLQTVIYIKYGHDHICSKKKTKVITKLEIVAFCSQWSETSIGKQFLGYAKNPYGAMLYVMQFETLHPSSSKYTVQGGCQADSTLS